MDQPIDEPVITQKPEQHTPSLRTVIKAGGVLGIIGAIGGGIIDRLNVGRIQRDMIREDWAKADKYKTAEEFIEKNKDWLKDMRFAFNLSEEEIWHVFNRKEMPDPYDATLPSQADTVNQVVEEFGMDEGRFTFRMSEMVTVDPNDTKNPIKIDIAKYIPWMDEYADKGIKLTINTGIKAARWPEVHVDNELLNYLYEGKVPGNGRRVIRPDDPLADFTLNTFYPEFYRQIKEYNKARREAKPHPLPELIIDTIQPENEPQNPFGEKKWVMSEEYMVEAIRIANENFPDAKILLNTPPIGLEGIRKIVEKALEENENLRGIQNEDGTWKQRSKIMVGLNHYFRQPDPAIFGIKPDDKDPQKVIDNLMVAELLSPLPFIGDVAEELALLESYGVDVVTAEAQAETWGHYETPGNNFNEFIYELLRCKRIQEMTGNAELFKVFVWGIEQLVYNRRRELTEDQMSDPTLRYFHHREIARLMKGVNALSKAA